MSFVEMDFMQFHRIVHAHSVSQLNYQYCLSSFGCGIYGPDTYYGGVLEIGVVEKNPLIFDFVEQNRRLTVGEGDVYIIPPNHRINVSALNPGEHRHSSVEFLIDCITRPLHKEALSPSDCGRIRGLTVILPYLLPASKENDELIPLIRQLARDRMYMVEKSFFEECQAFMQIISILSSLLRRHASPSSASPAHQLYCQKAKEYISQHIDRHVSLEEIADYVGINKNYLTNVFTACEKTRLSEYVNRVKLNHMLELIVKYGVSIRQASEAVGFSDVNYVSRLFKKYHGVTISEYRRSLSSKSSRTLSLSHFEPTESVEPTE